MSEHITDEEQAVGVFCPKCGNEGPPCACPVQPPTVAEWLARYKARMLEVGVPEDAAQAAVEAVDMNSGEDSTYSLDDDPEHMADEELSYWGDDGE